MKVQVKKIFGDTKLPEYATEGSAGFDLIADNFKSLYPYHIPCDEKGIPIDNAEEYIDLSPGSRILIGTGIAVKLPEGFEMQVRPRSGLALKYGISVLNSPGTIDEDYTGEIGVILINHGCLPFRIKLGDKIAQGIVSSYCKIEWNEVNNLENTKRGNGGYGHTDVINELKSRSNL